MPPVSSQSSQSLSSPAVVPGALPAESTVSSVSGLFRIENDPQGGLRLVGSNKLHPLLDHRMHSIIGMRLGDEGKGRSITEVIDELRCLTGIENPVALVIKVNGGANSGHTVIIEHEGETVKLGLNLTPTGIADKGVRHVALGGGVLADPFKLTNEGNFLDSYGLDYWNRLLIDENCMVADISHRIRDIADESHRPFPRGSTGRGISPGYEDESNLSAIRWSLFRTGDFEAFKVLMQDRLERCANRARYECGWTEQQWNAVFEDITQKEIKAHEPALKRGTVTADSLDMTRFRGAEPFTFNVDRVIEEYWKEGVRRASLVTDVGEAALRIVSHGSEHVICEHGQGQGLDKRNGTSKSRTGSHTGTSEIHTSIRYPVTRRINVIGIGKAYESAVGSHDFITKMDPDQGPDVALAAKLRSTERGVTTGRQRDVGHYDAVQNGQVLRTHGVDWLGINSIDRLTHEGAWQGNLKVCIGYQRPDGEQIQFVPREERDRKGLKPIYIEMPGWAEDISGTNSFAQWPLAAQRYFATLIVAPTKIGFRGMLHTPPSPRALFAGVGPGQGQIVKDIPEYAGLEALAYEVPIFGPPPPASES
ncbi:MAG: adenylosuccinate synthetase [Deltaproteobacteria bacterium]|nr:adenylosuccinate synthetase [Deltaproteobacteria bacterium]